MAEKADDKKADLKKGADSQKSPRVVSIDDKKSRQKDVISKLASEQPNSISPEKSPLNAPGAAKVQFNISFELDKAARAKIPFMIASIVFLAVSFIMLEKVGFSFADIFDFARISNNFDKLFSISFILFFILYCLSLALGAFFGFNVRSSNAFIFSMLVVIPIFIGFLLDPGHRYFLAYIWLAFGVILSVLFATLYDNLNFSSIYKGMGSALFILVLVAVLFSAVKVNSEKDFYFSMFISNVAKLTPQLQGQVQGSLGDVIENIKLSDAQITDLAADDSTTYMTDESIKSLVSLQYGAFREAVAGSFKKPDDQKYVRDNTAKTYALLDAASQNKLFEETKTALKNPSTSKVSGGAMLAVWPKMRKALADHVRNAEAKTELEEGDLAAIKSNLDRIPFVKQFKDYFEFFIALLLFSMLSAAVWVMRLLSSAFCFAITKII
ncbi:MAG: hypothetical protein AABX01_07280 [Candidatus Micrarchaeota archaeon]